MWKVVREDQGHPCYKVETLNTIRRAQEAKSNYTLTRISTLGGEERVRSCVCILVVRNDLTICLEK
jgi:hypothetical protein